MADPLPHDWFASWHAPSGGERLDDHVRARVPAFSKERVKQASAEGRLRLSGKVALAGVQIAKGSRVDVSISLDDASAFQASARAGDGFFPVFRDNDILVVDKGPGVLTVPTDEGLEAAKTGASGERALVERIADSMEIPARSLLTVHRLDRFTSGVLVIAQTPAAKAGLIEQFARHSIVRRYLAITQGVPSPRAGTFRSKLASDARRKQHVARDGEIAITHYEVAEELEGAALVWVALETGRRNQIRVHFAEAGWPLVGEHRYGREKDKALSRQALHAAELAFAHPRTKKEIAVASPLPPDMRRFVEKNR